MNRKCFRYHNYDLKIVHGVYKIFWPGLSSEKNRSVVFYEIAFDEVTFRRIGNSTKALDEVS